MSAPTLSPLRKGFADAAKQANEQATFGGRLGASGNRSNKRNGFTSRTLAALLLFVAVNWLWSSLALGRLEPEDYPFDTWTSCAINDYLHGIKEAPNVAFLGSSLVLFPTAGVDADWSNSKIDGPRHHQSWFFERDFCDHTGQKISTFDFALPGEMPSDAYLINRFLFRGGRKPDVIVYGVGPRDFMESLLPSPAATDPYQHLLRFGDLSDHISLLTPDWQERLNWELARLIYPYGHKVDLTHSLDRQASHVVSQLLPPMPTCDLLLRRKLLPEYKRTEVGVNECCFYSYAGRARPPFKDNIEEYRKRYKTLNWNTFLSQMHFLADSMELARQRGITFILVSMPITDLNRSLLSPQQRELFQKNLRLLAEAKGAKFYDLDSSGNYRLDEFEDTVHLNSSGGRKLLDTLACLMASDTTVRMALQQRPSTVSTIHTNNNNQPAKSAATKSGARKNTSASQPEGTPIGDAITRGKGGKVDLATRRESYL